jgi:hypothetical protein
MVKKGERSQRKGSVLAYKFKFTLVRGRGVSISHISGDGLWEPTRAKCSQTVSFSTSQGKQVVYHLEKLRPGRSCDSDMLPWGSCSTSLSLSPYVY